MNTPTVQCLILWKVTTPHHGELNVHARDEEEAKLKALLFIEDTPLNKQFPTKFEQLEINGTPQVIQAVIL